MLRVRQVSCAPGTVVREYGGGGDEVGIITGGTADLVRIDYDGTRTILEHLETGSIFGEVLGFHSADRRQHQRCHRGRMPGDVFWTTATL